MQANSWQGVRIGACSSRGLGTPMPYMVAHCMLRGVRRPLRFISIRWNGACSGRIPRAPNPFMVIYHTLISHYFFLHAIGGEFLRTPPKERSLSIMVNHFKLISLALLFNCFYLYNITLYLVSLSLVFNCFSIIIIFSPLLFWVSFKFSLER